MIYYGNKISPHKIQSHEGYLLCTEVPICRTGEQIYLGRELGLRERYNEEIKVYRPEEEVFAPETIASFQLQPVTNGHPTEDVGPDNAANYSKGICANVRRGTGEYADCLLADLKILDPILISEIQNGGKNEISCGYNCIYEEQADGSFCQRNIRGNHIAVVPEGRAGHMVAIRDSIPVTHKEKSKRNGGGNMKKTGLLQIFARAVKDAEPDEIETMAETVSDVMAEKAEKEEAKETMAETKDLGPLAAAGVGYLAGKAGDEETAENPILAALEGLTKRIAELEARLPVVEKKDALDELMEETQREEQQDEAPEEVEVIEEVQEEKEAVRDSVIRDAVKALKPIIVQIPDMKARDAAAQTMANVLRKSYSENKNSYADIAQGAAMQARTLDSAVKPVDYRAIEESYNKRDPHRKEN